MKLGTVVYDNDIYNLDYMTSDEVKNILDTIEMNKKENINNIKEIDFNLK